MNMKKLLQKINKWLDADYYEDNHDDHMRKYHCEKCEEHLKKGKGYPHPHEKI